MFLVVQFAISLGSSSWSCPLPGRCHWWDFEKQLLHLGPQHMDKDMLTVNSLSISMSILDRLLHFAECPCFVCKNSVGLSSMVLPWCLTSPPTSAWSTGNPSHVSLCAFSQPHLFLGKLLPTDRAGVHRQTLQGSCSTQTTALSLTETSASQCKWHKGHFSTFEVENSAKKSVVLGFESVQKWAAKQTELLALLLECNTMECKCHVTWSANHSSFGWNAPLRMLFLTHFDSKASQSQGTVSVVCRNNWQFWHSLSQKLVAVSNSRLIDWQILKAPKSFWSQSKKFALAKVTQIVIFSANNAFSASNASDRNMLNQSQ